MNLVKFVHFGIPLSLAPDPSPFPHHAGTSLTWSNLFTLTTPIPLPSRPLGKWAVGFQLKDFLVYACFDLMFHLRNRISIQIECNLNMSLRQ